MKINRAGLELIKSFEGCVLHPYNDGFGNITVGYGHLIVNDDYNRDITEAEAEEILKRDIERFEANVNKYVSTYNFNENEFSALVSFAFNIGSVDELLKWGDLPKCDICNRMLLYCHAGDEVVEGLQRRRKAEVDLYKTPCEAVKDSSYYVDLIVKTLTGYFGNGEERARNLGSDYDIVQNAINAMYDCFK